MNDNEGLHILSDYVKGCGGVLCAGWHARPHWNLKTRACPEAGLRLRFTFTPPQGFKPVAGQPSQKQYTALSHVALAMGLEPNIKLAVCLLAAARAEKNSAPVGQCMRRPLTGARSSSPGPQNIGTRKRKPTQVTAGPHNECEAGPGPKVPHTQPSMRSSRSRSSLDVKPNMNDHDSAEQEEQRNLAVAGRSTAKPGKAGSKRPNLARASGMQHRLVGRLSDQEVDRLQSENREVKQRVATLELGVKNQQSQQDAREEDMRAQQLAHTRTVNHLFRDIQRLEQQNATNSQVK